MKQDQLWDYYQTQVPESFDQAYPRLKFLAEKAGKGRVLNIGVGAGQLEMYLGKAGATPFSVDPSQKSIDNLNKIFSFKDHFKVGYIEKIPFEEKIFDTVIVSEVLEHLDNTSLDSGLDEIYRVLKPSGTLLVTTPYKENIGENTLICPHCAQQFHRWGHCQSFGLEDMKMRIEQKGFHIADCRVKLFTAWDKLNWKGKLVAGIKHLLFLGGQTGTGMNIFAVQQNLNISPD